MSGILCRMGMCQHRDVSFLVESKSSSERKSFFRLLPVGGWYTLTQSKLGRSAPGGPTFVLHERNREISVRAFERRDKLYKHHFRANVVQRVKGQQDKCGGA